ncbi:MAG: YceI family protein [Paracoccaceae bacterium]
MPLRCPARLARMALVLSCLAGTAAVAQDPATMPSGPPAGTYHIDPPHGRLLFSVNHLGFSEYIGLFRTFTATLAFDPAAPEKMQLEAQIDPKSIETLYKDPTLDFNAVLAGPELLDAAKYPDMTFKSTQVRVTSPSEAAVTGDLTLHGFTRPVTMHVRYNGGYAGNPLDPGGARIGFSAEGALFRSDFGMTFGIPAPGTMMGVGDLVSFRIEVEMINPDAPGVQVGP